jgi:hypothetical protein
VLPGHQEEDLAILRAQHAKCLAEGRGLPGGVETVIDGGPRVVIPIEELRAAGRS